MTEQTLPRELPLIEPPLPMTDREVWYWKTQRDADQLILNDWKEALSHSLKEREDWANKYANEVDSNYYLQAKIEELEKVRDYYKNQANGFDDALFQSIKEKGVLKSHLASAQANEKKAKELMHDALERETEAQANALTAEEADELYQVYSPRVGYDKVILAKLKAQSEQTEGEK